MRRRYEWQAEIRRAQVDELQMPDHAQSYPWLLGTYLHYEESVADIRVGADDHRVVEAASVIVVEA